MLENSHGCYRSFGNEMVPEGVAKCFDSLTNLRERYAQKVIDTFQEQTPELVGDVKAESKSIDTFLDEHQYTEGDVNEYYSRLAGDANAEGFGRALYNKLAEQNRKFADMLVNRYGLSTSQEEMVEYSMEKIDELSRKITDYSSDDPDLFSRLNRENAFYKAKNIYFVPWGETKHAA